MNKIILMLSAMLMLPLQANDATQKQDELLQQEVKPSICYATLLNRFRAIIYSFCLEEDGTIRIFEYTNQGPHSRVKKTFRCWASGEYSGKISENNLQIKTYLGECSIYKEYKPRSLSCVKSKIEGELTCKFADKKDKSYRFTKAEIVRRPNKDLCKNDKDYLTQNNIACQTHFGMEQGVDLMGQRQMRVRMRAESRHRTQ